ncbi:MAG: hypothetical protein RIQ93_134 [Verrucomicrobiota bacterium]|jgi:putative membrane-bound dehydrogenase-like protein
MNISNRLRRAALSRILYPGCCTMVLLAACGLAGPAAAAERTKALSPQEALAAFQLGEPGLRIELVAAEPLVVDPVAFAFDEYRKLYVVEDRGYPDPIGKPGTTEGTIALLEDTDGDGRYDKRTDFARDLGYPTGIMPWRGGVFVTCAPDVIYLKDTNGDGVADERRVVLTGFAGGRTAQLRISFPTLGLDGKIYFTSGLQSVGGGQVTSPLHPERAPVPFPTPPVDGRFDPETFVYEPVGGKAQFGLAFDGFGRKFTNWNRAPVLQVVMQPWQLARNPYLSFAETEHEVSEVQGKARVYPVSRATISADYAPSLMATPHTGTFTAACGVLIFGGGGLAPEHMGNAFICEPAQNLVQRQTLRPDGVAFRSSLPYTGKEFLSSTDTWFRPVFLATGPDGAMYVADFHRRELDHPQYVPEEMRPKLDFESGKGTGRIYRVVRQPRAMESAGVTVADLCRGVDSPEVWWRNRAHRLLVERADPAAAPLLEKLAVNAKLAESRTLALWILRGLGRLSPATVNAALRDADPRVREQGVKLAAEALDKMPELRGAVIAAGNDPDTRVRFESALALGSLNDPAVVPVLAKIAIRDGQDRWTRAAVLSGIGSRLTEFFEATDRLRGDNPAGYAALVEDLGRLFGAGAPADTCRRFLAQMVTGEGDLGWRLPAVLGLAEGLNGRADFSDKAPPPPARKSAAPQKKGGGRGGAGRAANPAGPFAVLLAKDATNREALDRFFAQAAGVAKNDTAPLPQRTTAITLLGYGSYAVSGPVLGTLLGSRHPVELQLQAVRALERLSDPKGGELLVKTETWNAYTPQVRQAVLSTLGSRPQMVEVLFGAMRRGVIKPLEIPSTQRTRLLQNTDPALRKEAETAFREFESGDRMQVYRTYRETLKSEGKIAQGREVFTRACSACHTYNGAGGKVGPDITGLRNQPAETLLLHIVVPNFEITPGYQAFSATTQDGRNLTGWLVAEGDNSVTFRTVGGTDETVLRSNIGSLTTIPVSLMPDGLEQAMTNDEISNLISYIKKGVEPGI